jgi:hypothetical protein
VITLADDTIYFLTNDISSANRYVMGDNTVLASEDQVVSLGYTGTGAMFTGTDVECKIKDISLNQSNVAGSLFNMTNASTANFFTLDNVRVIECGTIGTINNFQGFQSSNVIYDCVNTDGFTFTGAFSVIAIKETITELLAGDFIDLGTSTASNIEISGGVADLAAGTTFLKGAASSANINTGGLGLVEKITTIGAGTPLSGISSDDIRWDFVLNSDIPDTQPDGLLSLTVADTVTISAVDTPVLVAGPWNIERTSRFTGTPAGRLTYNGEKNVVVPVTLDATIQAASGTNKSITLYCAKNGSVVANSASTNIVGAGSPKNTSVHWQLEMAENDYVELWVENNTDTINLSVENAKIRLN